MTDAAPLNPIINPLLNDKYEFTMAYAYFKNNHHMSPASFEVFFRKNPFKGEFTILAGVHDCVKFIEGFKITDDQIAFLKKTMNVDNEPFFDFLRHMDMKAIKVIALPEGSFVFPHEPIMRIEGPVIHCQILEATILNLMNFSSLVTTNSARFRIAAGPNAALFEFGLRRAQGPDGGMSASRFSFMGGFNGTSNVLAAMLYDIPCVGTHAHSFVTSYTGFEDLDTHMFEGEDMVASSKAILAENNWSTNESELVSFIAYAQAFPKSFLALIDTYDCLTSGTPNFLAVAYCLHKHGYKPLGIRIDSGDLSYLSKRIRDIFRQFDEKYHCGFTTLGITASNDINEEVLLSLSNQKHEINSFGIGTNLVTCQKQPALGMVYKLVEINGKPRLKLSQDTEKSTIPGKKSVYRIYTQGNSFPCLDLITLSDEPMPVVGEKYLCRHPFEEKKRVYVIPTKIEVLSQLIWDGALPNPKCHKFETLEELKTAVVGHVMTMREDHVRSLNPTPYKVSLSPMLYDFMHDLWMKECPVAVL